MHIASRIACPLWEISLMNYSRDDILNDDYLSEWLSEKELIHCHTTWYIMLLNITHNNVSLSPLDIHTDNIRLRLQTFPEETN